jgi:hypothetical protein
MAGRRATLDLLDVLRPYADRLRFLSATDRAFRRRRTLLLTDLASQVRMEELPWMRAVAAHRSAADSRAGDTLRHVGGLMLEAFPATPLPTRWCASRRR